MKNKFAATITKEEIQEKPIIYFEGPIFVIDGPSDAKIAIEKLSQNSILGFDTETKPIFRKGRRNSIAILQLSTQTEAFLFRLQKHFPPEIKPLLENPEIKKIGAAIHDDLKSLKKYLEFEPGGFIDLQNFVKQFEIENSGLKKLAAIVLGRRISKSQQTSNWENPVLTEAQQIYAATDAWVCLEIFKQLNSN
jgi:ribonuclease D